MDGLYAERTEIGGLSFHITILRSDANFVGFQSRKILVVFVSLLSCDDDPTVIASCN